MWIISVDDLIEIRRSASFYIVRLSCGASASTPMLVGGPDEVFMQHEEPAKLICFGQDCEECPVRQTRVAVIADP